MIIGNNLMENIRLDILYSVKRKSIGTVKDKSQGFQYTQEQGNILDAIQHA